MKMFKTLTLAVVLVVTSDWALAQNTEGNAFSAKVVAQQRLLDYTRAQNEMLHAFSQTNSLCWNVDAERILELRTMEYQLQWFHQNGLLEQPPAMVLVGVPLRHKQELPGRILEVRLQAAKLDFWQQQLGGKSFAFAKPTRSDLASFFGPPTWSTNFPVEGDFMGANAYARNLVLHREFADAAKQFEAAALKVSFGGTATKQWEYENLVSSAWAYLMAGDFEKSFNRLTAAQALPLQAEVPGRARFLLHFYRFPDAPALSADWDAALPK
jgi:hypothetical protein